MKVLIYGSRGWIGGKFVKIMESHNVEYLIGKSRASNVDNIRQELDDNKDITHVVSFIGRTHGVYNGKVIGTIDYLENPGKLVDNVNDNLFSPMVLAMLCNERNIHYTYLGTGCIFEFDETHPFGKEENGFTEESAPNFFGSSYSIVKGYTDSLMKLFDKNVLNVRIRMPITDEYNARNFITKISTYKKVCSVPNSMTVLNELLPILLDMMKNKTVGTVNLTNPGLITHNEILTMYKEIVDNDFKWENFSIDEQNVILLSKRSNNFLDTTKLETLYPSVMNIKDSIKVILHKMKENKDYDEVK
jgi:dTDP-4-dehydrorhamnose reductase